jgi:hypothetical protein
MNTMYDQQELVKLGLATASKHDGLITFKYSRHVMFQDLWTPELLECRGHTYEEATGKPVTVPFPKFFDYGHQIAGFSTKETDLVTLYKKVNGFMLAATIFNEDIVVSTTGSTKSDFAKWGAEEMIRCGVHKTLREGVTTLMEIILPQDPHIVPEEFGAHVLAHRKNSTGQLTLVYPLKQVTLAEAFKLAATTKTEGFMVQTASGEIFKLKSDYYRTMKLLMRKREIPKHIPDAYPGLVEAAKGVVNWLDLGPLARREFLEGFV